MENRLREIRKQRKITQVELAEKCNVAQGTIQKLETGAIELNITWMRELAKILNVEPFELLPKDMQPVDITPEEREILRMIRKTTSPQSGNNQNISTQTDSLEHSGQPLTSPQKSNGR